jgi:hypothetical protein
MKLWIVADVKSEDGSVWELLGVFDSSEKAVAACTQWNHCVWSTELNQRMPDETHHAPDAHYPLAGDRLGAAVEDER